MQTLFLKRSEEKRIKAGHLWIFSNEVDVKRSPLTSFEPGQPVHIADYRENILGSAYVNPKSLIAARLVSTEKNTPLSKELLLSRLQSALRLRENLFDQPFYRLCHAEGDYLPGLVVDRFGDHLTVQISTAGMERVCSEVVEVLVDMLQPKSIFLCNTMSVRSLEGLELEAKVVYGDAPSSIDIIENNCTYRAPFTDGQKTGWFYDHRPNRAAIIPFIKNAHDHNNVRVLDVFCYAGAFGALAAHHGATHVSLVDSTAKALEFAKENVQNQKTGTSCETFCGNAFDILADLARDKQKFNVICIDPPAFIKRKKDVKNGLEAYARINDLAISLLAPEGVLLTASCSYHLEAEALHRMVLRSSTKKNVPLRLLYKGYQGADHPIHPAMSESAYLKAFLYQSVT